jgi:hypothetical protein
VLSSTGGGWFIWRTNDGGGPIGTASELGLASGRGSGSGVVLGRRRVVETGAAHVMAVARRRLDLATGRRHDA